MISRVYSYDSNENVQYRGTSFEITRTNILPFLFDWIQVMEELHQMQLNMMDDCLRDVANLQQYTKMVNLYKLYRDEIIRVHTKQVDDYIAGKQAEINETQAALDSIQDTKLEDEALNAEAKQLNENKRSQLRNHIQELAGHIEQKKSELELMKQNIAVYETECVSYTARMDQLRKERKKEETNIITDKFFVVE